MSIPLFDKGKVIGNLLGAILDTTVDPDKFPDEVPLAGKVTFVSRVPMWKNTAGAAIFPGKFEAAVTNGWMVNADGDPFIWLPTGLYEVTYELTYLATKFTVKAHQLPVTEAHTDLAPANLLDYMDFGGTTITMSQYAELSSRIDALPTGGGGGEGGAVWSVNGATGAVVLDADDVGALPSTYTPPAQSWTQITSKPATFPPSTHTHTIANVTNLQTTLDAKAATVHTHTLSQITDYVAPDLSGYSLTSHTHTWASITNKPSTFTPAAHSHGVSDLNATGTANSSTYLRGDGTWSTPPTGEGGGAVDSVNGQTGTVVLDAADVDALPSSYTPPAQSWTQITGKPTTFTPSTHGHVWGEITGTPATYPPTIGTTATTAKAGNYQPTWAQVTGKPTTFPPDTHTHAYNTLTGLPTIPDSPEDIGAAPTSHSHTVANVSGLQDLLDAKVSAVVVTTGNEARPTGADHVLWIGGSTQPVNAVANVDIWFEAGA